MQYAPWGLAFHLNALTVIHVITSISSSVSCGLSTVLSHVSILTRWSLVVSAGTNNAAVNTDFHDSVCTCFYFPRLDFIPQISPFWPCLRLLFLSLQFLFLLQVLHHFRPGAQSLLLHGAADCPALEPFTSKYTSL